MKKEELVFRMDQKREQLLELKRAQVAARSQGMAPELEADLQRVRERMAAYQLRRTAEQERKAAAALAKEDGFVQIGLGKKKKDAGPAVRVEEMPFAGRDPNEHVTSGMMRDIVDDDDAPAIAPPPNAGSGTYSGLPGIAARK